MAKTKINKKSNKPKGVRLKPDVEAAVQLAEKDGYLFSDLVNQALRRSLPEILRERGESLKKSAETLDNNQERKGASEGTR